MVEATDFGDLIAKARIEDQACDWTRARSLYVAASKVADTKVRKAYALNNAAISSRRAGDIDKALRLLIQASHALEGEDDVPTKAETELAIGNALVDAERLSDAMPHFQNAIAIFRRLSRDEEVLYAEIGLGRALALQGRNGDAEKLFLRALSAGRSDDVLSQALNSLAIIRRHQGRHLEAEELFRRDEELCRDSGDLYGEAVALANLARVKDDLGQTSNAAALLENALKLFRLTNASVEAERTEQDLTMLRRRP